VLDSRHDVGDRIEISHGDEASRGTWEVGNVWESPEEEPDTLAIRKPPIRDA
jgi:hypothetical protein